MTLTHLNPDSLPTNPAFSQGVRISAGTDLLVVGGQNGIDTTGNLVGPDLHSQTAQALGNVLAVLAEVGASQEDVAKLTIYLAAGSDVADGFAAAQEVWGRHATAVSVIMVAALGRPGFLVEIEALAQIPPS